MSRIEYDLLREQEPWMKLPDWYRLRDRDKSLVQSFERAQMINYATRQKIIGGFLDPFGIAYE